MDLDLLVIGSGPSGQKAAIQAAKLGKRVAVVERKQRLGGVSIHTGTIPSKTLRVAVLGRARPAPARHPRPAQPRGRERAAIEFLMDRAARVVGAEAQVVREQFRRNRVGLLFGNGQFVDEHTISITDEDRTKEVTADNIIIAAGTYPARPADVQFDDEHVIDSDGLLNLHQRLPRSMTVVGAGVIGVEYASMFGRLGTKVTVVDQRPRVLTFLDGEIGEALQFILRRNNVTFRLQEKVASVGTDKATGDVITRLASGKEIHVGDRALRDRPPGRDRHARPQEDRDRAEQARLHRGRRRLPHEGAPRVRRRRLLGRLRPRGDGDGAGPPGGAARVRPAGVLDARAAADRRLRDPGDRDGRAAPRRT